MGIILASASPRRKEILEMLGVKDMQIIPAQGEEASMPDAKPEELVCALALAKGREVAEKAKAEDIVIAADTIVWYGDKVFGKPHSREEAISMLCTLAGNTHQVYTGVALICGGREIAAADRTNVRFRSISKEEIEAVISAGADVIMLPYFKARDEVENFIRCVDGRAITMILVETKEAAENIDDILEVPGIDEVHIGLNDLHLSYGMKFMFELLADGTVEKLCRKIADKGLKYGFGGIARVGYGVLPAEYIIGEHYHLGSTSAILSRGFCDANIVSDPSSIESIFIDGIANIRKKELEFTYYAEKQFADNQEIVQKKVREIVKSKE